MAEQLSVFRRYELARKQTVLAVSVPLMGVAAAVWLTYQWWRFFMDPKRIGSFEVAPGAVDLMRRYDEVHQWFGGLVPYGTVDTATYPPASLLMLWPLTGWGSVSQAKWSYAIATVAATVWLIRLIVRASGAESRLERAFIGLMPCAMYALGATIGNGQLTVLVLPAMLAGLLLVASGPRGWGRDLFSATLVLISLVKLNISVPFFWVALWVPGRLRPAALVAGGYVLLTLWACAYQEDSAVELMRAWLEGAHQLSARGARFLSHGNLQSWLMQLGLGAWVPSAAVLALGGMGLWTFLHRRRDIWLVLGVTGIFTRLWTYHGWYDDLLILPAMIALFRVAKLGGWPDSVRSFSGFLLGATLCMMIAPGGQHLLASPWKELFLMAQQALWLIVLSLLVYLARRDGGTSDRVG